MSKETPLPDVISVERKDISDMWHALRPQERERMRCELHRIKQSIAPAEK